MSPASIVLLVLGFLALDVLVVALVMRSALALGWNALAHLFPERQPAPGAVRREFQSISIGLANYGLCAHIAVDQSGLHVRPARFLRLFGARGFSPPWEQVAFKKRRRAFGLSCVEVSIAGRTLTGPAWCLELAGAPPA